MDRHLQPEPRMPTIKQFSENGLVGVLKRCCTTADAPTRALTALRPIRRTSRRCPSARQPNPGRGSTYRRGNSVQTNGATAVARPNFCFGLARQSTYAAGGWGKCDCSGAALGEGAALGLKTNINSNTAMPRLFAMLLVSPLCGLCPVGSERAEIGGKINWHGPLEMMANHAYR
jgi:hypothetical protein